MSAHPPFSLKKGKSRKRCPDTEDSKVGANKCAPCAFIWGGGLNSYKNTSNHFKSMQPFHPFLNFILKKNFRIIWDSDILNGVIP